MIDEGVIIKPPLIGRSIARKLVIILSIVLLTFLQLLIYYRLEDLSQQSSTALRITQTIQNANSVLDGTREVELNVKNYLLTNDESYLTDLQAIKTKLILASNQYDAMTESKIASTVKSNVAILNKLTELKKNGTILPSDISSLSQDNQSLQDKINADLTDTINTQYQFLSHSYDKTNVNIKIIFSMLAVSILIGITFLLKQLFSIVFPRKQAEISTGEMNKINEKLQERENQNEKMTLLLEMSDVMLASENIQEISNIITKYCGRILTFSSGLLYIMHSSKNYLEATASWGAPRSNESYFSIDNCWSIRLGHIYDASSNDRELFCSHVKPNDKEAGKPLSYLCVPLRARNDIYGLLYIEIDTSMRANGVLNPDDRMLVNSFTELAALALANINFQHSLQYQSLRDHLTSLYNRRYLEEFLTKLILQYERTQSPLAVLMIDIDNFKMINDKYGHEAGDMAIKELAMLLLKDVRPGDLAARYGGEEFIIVLYNMSEQVAKKRAEQLREDATHIRIKRGVGDIINLTISIGVALYPRDGNTTAALIESADKALYFAKNSGKDRVVMLSDITSQTTDILSPQTNNKI